MRKLITFLSALIINFSANAIDAQKLNKLSQNKQWLKLLTIYDGQNPKVTDPNFLLTSKTNFSSLAELKATLEAFSAPAMVDNNKHGQCKYPARLLFLKENINLNEFGIENIVCPDYSEYTDINGGEQLSLIFATGFLGNPASYYGHLLLKINQKDKTNLEQASINFGADIPANEGMVSYIVKGIVGGYESSFTTQPFFYHFNNYNETEHRDLWEYPIVLAPAKAELVIAHLWELMNIDFQYFFFNRNCAYFMARAIELVIDNRIIREAKPWVGPQEVIQKLNLSTSNGEPVLGVATYHPSRQTRLYQRFASLNSTEKEKVRTIVAAPETLSLKNMSDISLESKYRIVDTLIDYYQFVRDKKNSDDKNNLHYKTAVILRYQLPIAASSTKFESQNPPALGRGISRTYIGLDNLGAFVGIRPAYYDSLDASYGHVKHAELTMGGVELIVNSGKLHLYSLSLLSIESIKQNYTMLPGDKNHSWYLKIGAEQAHLNCRDCLTPLVEAGAGLSQSFLSSDLALSGFVTAGYNSDSLESDGIFAGTNVKANWVFSSKMSAAITLNHRHFLSDQTRTALQLKYRSELTNTSDLRLSWSHDFSLDHNKIAVNFGYYW